MKDGHKEGEEGAKVALASERLYQTLLDGVDELIGITDARGKVRYANAAVQRTLGYTAAEMEEIGVFDLVSPEDLPVLTDAFVRGIKTPGLRITVELRVRGKDGAEHVIDASGTSMLHDPVIHGVVIHGRDVTARKKGEREARERENTFAALLSNLSGMAYRARRDAHGTFDLVTDGCVALTGYEADELKGSPTLGWSDLVHPEDRSLLEASRRASLDAHGTSADEFRIRCKSGELRWVADVAHGVLGSDGAMSAIEGFWTDVTARKRLEAQLEHSQRLEGIGRLAGGIAHDFNNVLGVIISYADLAREGLEPGDQRREDILEIERAGRRAAALTSQLLAFARRQVVQPRALDLNVLTHGIDKLLRRVLGEDVALETVLEDRLWPVKADPGQIEQVLLNLAVNARDAMPTGGRLSIETANVLVDEALATTHVGLEVGPHVRISVSDTGTGMTPAAIEHLFEPFFTTKAPGKGTGLGLAMCYGIVRQSGGAIGVERSSEPGTTFTIWLPRTDGAALPASMAPPATAASGGGEVLLLVEDYRTLREVAARALRAHGYQVLVASGGAEALALVASHPGEIHLLVTDVIMAGMDGHELAEKLSAQRPGIRVLYVSGYMESDVLERRIGGAEASFLPKPFTPEQLARRVREVLDG